MSTNDKGGLSFRPGWAGRIGAVVLSVSLLLLAGGCGDASQDIGPAAQAEAVKTLEGFLDALKNAQLKEAYGYLSRAQKAETPFDEFAEGYQAGTVSIAEYTIEGIAAPEASTAEQYKEYAPFLVPKGKITLLAVKDDGLAPSGTQRRIGVPLSWILMVPEGKAWRVQGKGWGPLHTVAFFGRPHAIVNTMWQGPEGTPMRYEDDARRYQITLAQDWDDCSRHPSLASLAASVQTRLVAMIGRPGQPALPNVTIQTFDVSRYPSIQSPMDYAHLLQSSQRGTELQAPAAFSHEGLSGVRWEYKLNQGLASVHSVTDYYLDGRTMILVSSVSQPGRFEQDKKEILPMLDSFRFAPKSASGVTRVSRQF